MKRKEFNKVFLPYNESGTQIWVITRVKELPDEIVQMAVNLAKLDFIKYVRLCDETLAASNRNYTKRPKVPMTFVNNETASGIHLLYDTQYKTIDFFDINSPTEGHDEQMVKAVFTDFPKGWKPVVIMAWSKKFWDRMEKKYSHLNWFIC